MGATVTKKERHQAQLPKEKKQEPKQKCCGA